MSVEHQHRNLTKEEQIRCTLRLLELLSRRCEDWETCGNYGEAEGKTQQGGRRKV